MMMQCTPVPGSAVQVPLWRFQYSLDRCSWHCNILTSIHFIKKAFWSWTATSIYWDVISLRYSSIRGCCHGPTVRLSTGEKSEKRRLRCSVCGDCTILEYWSTCTQYSSQLCTFYCPLSTVNVENCSTSTPSTACTSRTGTTDYLYYCGTVD